MSDRIGQYIHGVLDNTWIDSEFKIALMKPRLGSIHENYYFHEEHEIENGNGYIKGGKIVNLQPSFNESGVSVHCNDISWRAVGGQIGPIMYAVIYDISSKAIVYIIDFGKHRYDYDIVNDGESFNIYIDNRVLFNIVNLSNKSKKAKKLTIEKEKILDNIPTPIGIALREYY